MAKQIDTNPTFFSISCLIIFYEVKKKIKNILLPCTSILYEIKTLQERFVALKQQILNVLFEKKIDLIFHIVDQEQSSEGGANGSVNQCF